MDRARTHSHLWALFLAVTLGMQVGCATTTQRYGVSVENNKILRGIERGDPRKSIAEIAIEHGFPVNRT